MKFAVVVDVQNCFMFSDDQNKTFLNLAEKNVSLDMVKEITDIVEDVDTVIFTRDFHPINHISFGDGEENRVTNPLAGTWPLHCRNRYSWCKSRLGDEDQRKAEDENYVNIHKFPQPKTMTLRDVTDSIQFINYFSQSVKKSMTQTLRSIDQNYLQTPVYGTDLSYYFYASPLAEIVYKLNKVNKKGQAKIGLKATANEEPDTPRMVSDDDYKSMDAINIYAEPLSFMMNGKEKKGITLTKGERCTDESYSAFNYHITYVTTNPSLPEQKDLPIAESNTTGLWEFLILKTRQNMMTNPNDNVIDITVCGLVTNVCVMHTVLQGIAMWNQVYGMNNKDLIVNFHYSLKGSRFAIAVPPYPSMLLDSNGFPYPDPAFGPVVNSNYYAKENKIILNGQSIDQSTLFTTEDITKWLSILTTKNNRFQENFSGEIFVGSFDVVYYDNSFSPKIINYYTNTLPGRYTMYAGRTKRHGRRCPCSRCSQKKKGRSSRRSRRSKNKRNKRKTKNKK